MTSRDPVSAGFVHDLPGTEHLIAEAMLATKFGRVSWSMPGDADSWPNAGGSRCAYVSPVDGQRCLREGNHAGGHEIADSAEYDALVERLRR